MPETSRKTEVHDISGHMGKVRDLLKMNPQKLENIQVHLGLTKPQTLAVLERLEAGEEIFRLNKVWRLR